MDMVRPWKDPWGLSPSLRPWEARTVLRDICGRSRPVGLPRSSRDAYVGCVPLPLWWAPLQPATGAPDMSQQSPLGPGTWYFIRYQLIHSFTGRTCQFLRNRIDVGEFLPFVWEI